MQNNIVIATTKSWNIVNAEAFVRLTQWSCTLVTEREALNKDLLEELSPRFVFFPHWSWVIPSSIYSSFECVLFHMTDLPYGRGGSPLQNLILEGNITTKISALRVTEGIDEGPIYCKRTLSLDGSAEAIYKRASDIVFTDMIPYILENAPAPTGQTGKPHIFSRRTPEQSRIPDSLDPKGLYDYIRMLDAPTYPNAFIMADDYTIELTDASIEDGVVAARAIIKVAT